MKKDITLVSNSIEMKMVSLPFIGGGDSGGVQVQGSTEFQDRNPDEYAEGKNPYDPLDSDTAVRMVSGETVSCRDTLVTDDGIACIFGESTGYIDNSLIRGMASVERHETKYLGNEDERQEEEYTPIWEV